MHWLVIFFVLLGQLVGLRADQHAHFWYDPSNWGLGWQLCSMNRLSQKCVDPTYEPEAAPAWKVTFTEEELRERLTRDEYWVTQQKGHSLKAPVGRWQKGKDLTWYTKQSKVTSNRDNLKAEIAAVKRAEEEAMAAALGLKPSTPAKPHGSLTKQEIAEVCRRKSVEEREEAGEERMKGIGFQSRRSQMMYSGTESTTNKEGATIFEHDPSLSKGDGLSLKITRREQPVASPPPVRGKRKAKEDSPAAERTSKKKHKKDKKSKKHKRKDPYESDSEGSEGERRRKRRRHHEKYSHKHKRRRHDTTSGSD